MPSPYGLEYDKTLPFQEGDYVNTEYGPGVIRAHLERLPTTPPRCQPYIVKIEGHRYVYEAQEHQLTKITEQEYFKLALAVEKRYDHE